VCSNDVFELKIGRREKMKRVVILLLVLLTASLASANLLNNGSFETPIAAGWWHADGWTPVWGPDIHRVGGADTDFSSVPAHDGGYYMYTDVGGCYQQEVSIAPLTADSVVTFSAYWYRDVFNTATTTINGPAQMYMVTNNWDFLGALRIDSLPGQQWTKATISVKVGNLPNAANIIGDTGLLVRLQVSDTTVSPSTWGVNLFDAAELTVTPEPATLALLGLGGLLLRRKRA
jgi:hypothetical protein